MYDPNPKAETYIDRHVLTAWHRSVSVTCTILSLFIRYAFIYKSRLTSTCLFTHALKVLTKLFKSIVSLVVIERGHVVDRWFESRSEQTRDYKMSICWLLAKNAALRWKSKDWLARNQNIVSEWRATCLPADCCFSELAVTSADYYMFLHVYSFSVFSYF